VLATAVLGLAAYQLVLAAVVYGRVTPRFLEGRIAGFAHRASGRVIAAITAPWHSCVSRSSAWIWSTRRA
jgi:hypothetical protein